MAILRLDRDLKHVWILEADSCVRRMAHDVVLFVVTRRAAAPRMPPVIHRTCMASAHPRGAKGTSGIKSNDARQFRMSQTLDYLEMRATGLRLRAGLVPPTWAGADRQ